MKKSILQKNTFLLIACLVSIAAFSQFPPPPSPSVPIDGGLLSIVGAGIAYGGYKHFKDKKKNK
tara:strand:+ start:140064 stop:140255 length:192 start_codon:yes stop_codon:yes gene_type:complete